MKLRRSLLFVPGSNPAMVSNAFIFKPDTVMFDLEDSVALNQKKSARILVHHALQHFTYKDVECAVRVNPLDSEFGLLDVEAVVRGGADIIRLPKTDTINDIETMVKEIERIEKEIGRTKKTKLIAAIESAKGVVNAVGIAGSSDRLIGIALGAEDFVRDLHTERTKAGRELEAARSQILLAARAADIQAYDSVFSDVSDMDGLVAETKYIKTLGFDGKSLISPNQIFYVHKVYEPTKKEIDWALDVIDVAEDAKKRGLGAVSLKGRMIDAPIILRAQRTIELAKASGVLGDEI